MMPRRKADTGWNQPPHRTTRAAAKLNDKGASTPPPRRDTSREAAGMRSAAFYPLPQSAGELLKAAMIDGPECRAMRSPGYVIDGIADPSSSNILIRTHPRHPARSRPPLAPVGQRDARAGCQGARRDRRCFDRYQAPWQATLDAPRKTGRIASAAAPVRLLPRHAQLEQPLVPRRWLICRVDALAAAVAMLLNAAPLHPPKEPENGQAPETGDDPRGRRATRWLHASRAQGHLSGTAEAPC